MREGLAQVRELGRVREVWERVESLERELGVLALGPAVARVQEEPERERELGRVREALERGPAPVS